MSQVKQQSLVGLCSFLLILFYQNCSPGFRSQVVRLSGTSVSSLATSDTQALTLKLECSSLGFLGGAPQSTSITVHAGDTLACAVTSVPANASILSQVLWTVPELGLFKVSSTSTTQPDPTKFVVSSVPGSGVVYYTVAAESTLPGQNTNSSNSVVIMVDPLATAYDPSSPSPAPAPAPVPAPVAQATNYPALVGIGSTDYNVKYAPSAAGFIVDSGDVTTAGRFGDTTVLQWRIFIPPGTKVIALAMWAYTGSPDIKGSMKFNALPTAQASEITPERVALVRTDNTLQQLVDGTEVVFYAWGGGGGVNLATAPTSLARPIVVTEGGWLYISILQVPGGRIQTFQAVISTDETCYRNWFAHAQFDSSGNPVEGVKHSCSATSVK